MSRLTELTGDISQSAELLAGLRVRTSGQTPIERLSVAEKSAKAQLFSLLEQIESTTHRANSLILGRKEADLTKRLEPGSWSVAECFDHLAQTTRAFLPAIANAMDAAPNLTSTRTLRTGTLARLFIRNLEPPYHLRFKVLAQLVPQHQDFAVAWAGFLESQSQLSDMVRSATGLAIDKVRIKSPVYARISYNVYGAFRILIAHERRHLWQAEQIFEALDLKRPPRNAA